MEGVRGQQEGRRTLRGESGGDEVEVERFVATVDFIANNRMPDVRKVDADLVFPSAAGQDFEEREGGAGAREGAEPAHFGDGRGAVGSHAILDGDDAGLVAAKRRVDDGLLGGEFAVDDGEVTLFHSAGFPLAAQVQGGGGVLRHEDEAAGFAVEAIDQLGDD